MMLKRPVKENGRRPQYEEGGVVEAQLPPQNLKIY